MTEHAFISADDQSAGVAFLRALADQDFDGMNLAFSIVDNPYSLIGQFAGIVIDYVRFVHEHGLGPSLDETLAMWGIASATP